MYLKKWIFFLMATVLFSINCLGQSNDGINYKAIIKDENGNVVANQSIDVQFQIMEGQGMELIYHEGHIITTNANGLVVLIIGEGTALDGEVEDLLDIEWNNGVYFYKVLVDIGNGLVDMGTDLFRSVPYAIQAEKANSAVTALTAANVTGLEAIDEGNGIGWRLVGRNPDDYGDIGQSAIDFSLRDPNSNAGGATGLWSIAMGLRATASLQGTVAIGSESSASGFGSMVFGSSDASGDQATAIGTYTSAVGDNSTTLGYMTTASGIFSTAMGFETVASGYKSTAFGNETKAESLYSTSFGSFNIGGGNSTSWIETDPIFEVGNGDPNNFSISNALTILKNGTITAPSLDLTEITDNKALITKEYADVNLGSSGLDAIDEGNGVGWRLKGRDPAYYGNIGLNAVDLSYSFEPSTTRGATGESSTAIGINASASAAYSTAIGHSATASGDTSIAIGYFSNATGFASTAIGRNNIASGSVSTAMGYYTISSGSISTTMGDNVIAASYAETAIGRYNTNYTPNDAENWNTNDRLLVVGNGTSDTNRRNALTILKNGKLYLTPTHDDAELNNASGYLIIGEESGANIVFDNNEMMARNNELTSPLYFQRDGGNVSIGNVGTPNVALDVGGSIQYTGSITDVSDRRLKENFKNIANALARIQKIDGYSYNMISDHNKAREYGVMAQDVQKVFPEMVSAIDSEEEYLGVSYIQLIPVLIEAIKEQQLIIENQNNKITALESLKKRVERLEALEKKLN